MNQIVKIKFQNTHIDFVVTNQDQLAVLLDYQRLKEIEGESLSKTEQPTNSISIIRPYKNGDTWVFDDARVGLIREPFVCGMPEIIDFHLNAHRDRITNPSNGFDLIFSSTKIPSFNALLVWQNDEDGGAMYKDLISLKKGWLCPALFKYFKTPPKELYIIFK